MVSCTPATTFEADPFLSVLGSNGTNGSDTLGNRTGEIPTFGLNGIDNTGLAGANSYTFAALDQTSTSPSVTSFSYNAFQSEPAGADNAPTVPSLSGGTFTPPLGSDFGPSDPASGAAYLDASGFNNFGWHLHADPAAKA